MAMLVDNQKMEDAKKDIDSASADFKSKDLHSLKR